MNHLAVVRAAEITAPDPNAPAWLVEHLWGRAAVGVLGGPPKSCKSWLALELAIATASARPCLGRFTVPDPGPVLLYAAEDPPVQVRQRIEQLCLARGTALDSLDLDVIVEPSLRIDRSNDLERLHSTLAQKPYRLLILDPYVRLQGADENHATEVAAILATLRHISRSFSLALLLVHHARKAPGNSAGLALRGSSDFHAWGDSNLYLRPRGPDNLLLTIEHRAAAAPPPLTLSLAQNPLRLEIRDGESRPNRPSLDQRVLSALQHGPLRLAQLRDAVGARKQSVLETLRSLEADGHISRTPDGWTLPAPSNPVPNSHPYIRRNREPLPSDPRQLDLINPQIS